MAVDSHGDSQYELLIDTVNNNSKSILSSNLNDKIECGIFPHTSVSLDSSRTESGSSRRKCCPLSKGITIEKFLEAEDSYQLTPIDKLLLKNKIALAQDQMKKSRAKSLKESVSEVRKETKKNGGKVVCSKIAAKRKTTDSCVIRSHEAAKCNGDVRIVSRIKNGSDSVIFRDALKSTGKLSFSNKNDKTRPQCANRKVKAVVKKKSSDTIRSEKNDRRISILKRCSLKKESRGKLIKKKKKPLELKRLKICLNYQTRSGNKERLRSGRPRIIKDKDFPSSSRTTKRPKNGNDTNAMAIESMASRNSLKRVIRTEPLYADCGISDKRKKVERWTSSSFGDKCGESDKNNYSKCENRNRGSRTGDTSKVSAHSCYSPRIYSLPNMKVESAPRVKHEVNQVENSNVFEIKVNMSLPVVVPETVRTNAIEPVGVNVKKAFVPGSDSSIESVSLNSSIRKEFSAAPGCHEANASYVETDEKKKLSSSLSSYTVFVNACTKKCTYSNSGDRENNLKHVTSAVDEGLSVLNSVPVESAGDRGFLDEMKCRLHSTESSNLTKESMFNALGLQSIDKLNQKPKEKEMKEKENYTGTLKAVIKIDKGCRKIEMKQQECNSVHAENIQQNMLSFYSKIMQNSSKSISGCSKMNISSSNVDDSTDDNFNMEPLYIESNTDKCDDRIVQNNVPLVNSITEAVVAETDDAVVLDIVKDKNKIIEPLVVPEKSSSFSIHPDRLCSDVCKYCYGKFGSLDTPCHVAQLKNSERQKKILSSEPNLKMDTCLCDACFRFVDRKANRPPIKRKVMRRSSMNQRILCAVQNCNQIARHYGKRKWRLKIGRKIANLSFDVSRRGSRMSFGLCTHHYCEVDLQTLCGICKKRLNRNDMYSIRSEVNGLNEILKQDNIPISLVDSTLLCKQCHHCMSLRIKYGNTCNMSLSNRQYYQCFKKQILHQHNVANNDQEDYIINAGDSENASVSYTEKSKIKRDEYDSSSPRVSNKNNHNVGIREIASLLKPLEAEHTNEKNSTHIQLKFGNLNIGKLSNLNIGQNTQPEPKHEKMASHDDLPLIADFSFENDGTIQKNWEKCISTIQFDQGTKKLWQDLQKPYGNQSSFIRHLIMLEKYWRSGALVLSEKAEAGAVKYINSVKNRVESLETSPTANVLPKKCVSLRSSPEVTLPTTNNCIRVCNASVNHVDITNRHASTPPPLLKLSSIPTSYVMRQVQVGNVKSYPEARFQTIKLNASSRTVASGQILPPPPVLKRMTGGALCANEVSVASKQIKEMTYSQLPRSKQFIHVNNAKLPVHNVSFLNKTQSSNHPPNMLSSTVSVNFPSKQFASPLMKTENNHQSMLLPKLPNTLTVTQIEEPSVKVKQESKPSLVLAPFLVGEKPSISVFREIAK